MKRIYAFLGVVIGAGLLLGACLWAVPAENAQALSMDAKPRASERGFSLTINNGEQIAYRRDVTLLIDGGPDADRMAISLDEKFTNASLIKYHPVSTFDLPEQEGAYTVYVKVYTRHGVASEPFSAEIIYQTSNVSRPSDHVDVYGNPLKAGDLFKKAETPAVYYYGADKKRYVFPTDKVFYSWFTQEDFKRVRVVSAQTVGNITIGGNITYRPGYRLIKIRTVPRVYAVGANKTLHWIENEGVARQLFGAQWSKKVHDVGDTLFGNYQVGSPVFDAKNLPDGFMIREAADATVYVIDDQYKRAFVHSDVVAQNRYRFDEVISLDALEDVPRGANITAREEKFADPAYYSYTQ